MFKNELKEKHDTFKTRISKKMIIQKTSSRDVVIFSSTEFISLKESFLQLRRRPLQLYYNLEQPGCTSVIITCESTNSNTAFPTFLKLICHCSCDVESNSHFLPYCHGFKTDRRSLLNTVNNTD